VHHLGWFIPKNPITGFFGLEAFLNRKTLRNLTRFNLYFFIFSLILAGILPYSGTLHYSFVFDDLHKIENNPHIHDISLAFQDLLDLKNISLSNLTFAANYQFGELSTTGYHLVNIALHVMNGILVFFLFRIIARHLLPEKDPSQEFVPFFGALFFLCHPVHTMGVTYITQRAGELAFFFYLLSLIVVLYYSERYSGKRLVLGFLFGLFCFFCAILSKRTAVSLPVMVIFLYLLLFSRERMEWKGFLLRVGLCLTVVLISIHFLVGFKSLQTGMMHPDQERSPFVNLLMQSNVIIQYGKILIVPHPYFLNVDHQVEIVESFFQFPTPLTFIFHLLLIGAGFFLFRKKPEIAFGIFWFYIAIAPTSSLIGRPDDMMEYRLYLPSLGFHWLTSLAIYRGFNIIFSRIHPEKLKAVGISVPKNKLIFGFPILIALIYASLTVGRNNVYENEFILWSDVMQKSPQKSRSYLNIGTLYLKRGDFRAAIPYLQKGKQLKPTFPHAYRNLGITYLKLGRLKEAITEFNTVRELLPGDPLIELNLARAHMDLGNFVPADDILTKEVTYKLQIHNILKLKYLAELYSKTDRFPKTFETLDQLDLLDPEDIDVPLYRGKILLHLGKLNQGEKEFLEVSNRFPNQGEAFGFLGYTYHLKGDFQKAKQYYELSLTKSMDKSSRIWVNERLNLLITE